ncbi:hypothetical protein ACJIZ3_022510 [Penstemon smallii]|uniref:Hydroxyproline-rich glycoprotein family protein n=1 Tax=Penstemon smallii TaxID=265156 RepID=A0ABD3TLI3_9LAMI
MAERQLSKLENRREKQPISIPFIWEEKPGTPKKDWKPTPQPVEPVAPPVKLIVSVPFGWEEKPGTPLPYFVQHPNESPEQAQSITFSSPPIYSDHDEGDDEQAGLSDSEIDTCSNITEDSYSSALSLLANGLISTTELSNAVPVQQTSLALVPFDCGLLQSPSSPDSETDSTYGSYDMRSTSLAGASFLEWLFPLLVTKSSDPDKVGLLENNPSCNASGTELMHESNKVRRPLLTLGELIVMSRRRSCQKKVTKLHKQPSMDFAEWNAFGCGIFGSGNSISELQRKWKRQLQLKLI